MNVIAIFIKARSAPKISNIKNQKASKAVIATPEEALQRKFQAPNLEK